MKYIPTIIRILFLALFVFLLANGKITLWLILFAISLLISIFFGRIYCGYICPMNTLMKPAAWLSRKFGIQSSKAPKWLRNGYFSWIVLVASIAAMLFSKKMLHISLPILPILLVLSLVITLRYRQEVFCNLICPFGALQRVFGKFAVFSARVDKDSCVGCGLCKTVCTANAITVIPADTASINTTLCHECGECIRICPHDAIHYSRKK